MPRGLAPGALGAPWLVNQRFLTPLATAVTFAPCGNFLAAKGSGLLQDCRRSSTGKEEHSGDERAAVYERGSHSAGRRFPFWPVSSTEKSWGDPSPEPPRGGSRGELSSGQSSQDLDLCLQASPLPFRASVSPACERRDATLTNLCGVPAPHASRPPALPRGSPHGPG